MFSPLPRLLLVSGVTVITMLLCHPAGAIVPLHAPTFSVHETLYGIETLGAKRYSIERILIHLHAHTLPEKGYLVQCFFLKKGKPVKGKASGPPVIDDTVLFEVTNLHDSYEVTANPIKLSDNKKLGKSKSSKKSKSKSSQQPKPSATDFPREGYVVRILSDGTLLRLHASNYPLERLAREHPELFNQAAASKLARHLEASDFPKK